MLTDTVRQPEADTQTDQKTGKRTRRGQVRGHGGETDKVGTRLLKRTRQ